MFDRVTIRFDAIDLRVPHSQDFFAQPSKLFKAYTPKLRAVGFERSELLQQGLFAEKVRLDYFGDLFVMFAEKNIRLVLFDS